MLVSYSFTILNDAMMNVCLDKSLIMSSINMLKYIYV